MTSDELEIIPYDDEEGITLVEHGKKVLIFVNGEERIVKHQFFDPIKGYIQTETAFYIPKEKN